MTSDPIQNAIYGGIKRGITVELQNECWGSAIILIYSAMDTMAFLGMPENQEDVTRHDFVSWVEWYIRIPGKEQVTPLELYGARCGMLHHFGLASKLSREQKVRQIGYMDKAWPPVVYHRNSANLVLVSISALADALFKGIDTFLPDLFSNPAKAKVAEYRLQHHLVSVFPHSSS